MVEFVLIRNFSEFLEGIDPKLRRERLARLLRHAHGSRKWRAGSELGQFGEPGQLSPKQAYSAYYRRRWKERPSTKVTRKPKKTKVKVGRN